MTDKINYPEGVTPDVRGTYPPTYSPDRPGPHAAGMERGLRLIVETDWSLTSPPRAR